ncbi:MAG: hypothetical protein V4654_13425 [Bdellovibrionota bacterium]
MMASERVHFEQSELIQRYFQDPEWTRFDVKTEAVLKRRHEFFAGRVCAALAYKKLTAKDLIELPINADRSPRWPKGIVGSISHNEKFVAAEVSSSVSGLGIDLATLGSVGDHLKTNICTQDDIDLNLTYVFSFKESLFKAVYPITNEFFDFQSASVVKVDLENKTFQIVLDEKISKLLKQKINYPESKITFNGDYSFLDAQTILSRVVLL